MPRKPSPETRSDSRRSIDSAKARGLRAIRLPLGVMAQIEAIRDRDGDPSLVAVVTRLVKAASA